MTNACTCYRFPGEFNCCQARPVASSVTQCSIVNQNSTPVHPVHQYPHIPTLMPPTKRSREISGEDVSSSETEGQVSPPTRARNVRCYCLLGCPNKQTDIIVYRVINVNGGALSQIITVMKMTMKTMKTMKMMS